MNNFNFYNPTTIVFGENRLNELNEFIPKDAKVLILYGGGSVKKYGTLSKVTESLGSREIHEFGGIEPNPQYTNLMKAVDIVKSQNITFLLAVGGGSVMDGTKFVSLASCYDGSPTDLFQPGIAAKKTKTAVPLGTVATYTTGSEMNSGGVISYESGKYAVFSPLAFPKFSFLDPTLSYTLPATQVANGVVDSFVHVIEQYLTYPANGHFQDRTAEGILLTLIEIGRKTIDNPNDYNLGANLVWCATNALNGLIGAGVPNDWSTHMIGHELTAVFGIDHAQTLAIVLPSNLRHRREKKREKLLQYATRVWNITETDKDKKIEMAIDKTEEFFNMLGVKSKLSEYDVPNSKIDDLVECLKKNGLTNLSETGDLTLDDSRKILEMSY